ALETILFHEGEDAVHFTLIVDVFGKDILVEGIAGRTVHVKKAVFLVDARAFRQEITAGLFSLTFFASGLKLGPRPENGLLGGGIEAGGVEHRSLVMVAQKDNLALHHQVNALAGIGPIAYDIAQAIDLGNTVFIDIVQNGSETFQITVDIAD